MLVCFVRINYKVCYSYVFDKFISFDVYCYMYFHHAVKRPPKPFVSEHIILVIEFIELLYGISLLLYERMIIIIIIYHFVSKHAARTHESRRYCQKTEMRFLIID